MKVESTAGLLRSGWRGLWPIVLLLGAAALGGWAITHSASYLLLVIAGPVVLGLIVLHPEWGLYAILASIFILRWLSDVARLIPRELSWLSEIALAAMLVRVVIITISEKRLLGAPITPFVALFILVGSLSAVSNNISPLMAFMGFRPYLKYVLMFYLLINLPLAEVMFKRIISLLMIASFAQFPISFLQWRQIDKSSLTAWDPVGGTLGVSQSGTLMILMIMSVCLCLGLYTCLGQKTPYLWMAMLLPIPILLGDAMAGWFYLLFAVLFTLRDILIRRPGLLLGVIAAIVIVYMGLLTLVPIIMPRSTLPIFLQDPFQILKMAQTTRLASGNNAYAYSTGRLVQVWLANSILPKDLGSYVWGLGPGLITPTFFKSVLPVMSIWQGLWVVNGIQIFSTVMEFGYVGLALFFVILFLAFRMNRRVAAAVTDHYWCGICRGFEGVWFMFIAGTIYMRVWNYDALDFTFWFLFAAIYRVGLQRGVFAEQGMLR